MHAAASEAGYAAKNEEDKKHLKYSKQHAQNGSKPNLIPLVYECFACWGHKADDYPGSLVQDIKRHPWSHKQG